MGKGETIVYNQPLVDSEAHIAAITASADVVAAVVVVVVEQLISIFPHINNKHLSHFSSVYSIRR